MKQLIGTGIVILCSILIGKYDLINRQVPKTVTLRLTEPQVMVVLKGLQELPLKESAELYFNIQSEAVRQLSPAAAPIKDSTKSKPKK